MKIFFNLAIIALVLIAGCDSTTYESEVKELYVPEIVKTQIDLVDSTEIYVNDNGSRELFYCSIVPREEIRGTLILLPSTFEPVENVISENNKLTELAYENGLLIIIPSINYNLFLDETSLEFLNTTFQNAFKKYEIEMNKIVIGGFSLGGMNAIRYSELAYENDSTTVFKPAAVYGVDPPLDWARIYYSFERSIELNFSEPAVNEAKIYLDKLINQFGGTPKEVPNVYAKHSMYSRTEKDGGNAVFLKDTPIRIYSDPDINWRLKEKRMDLYDMNVLDHSAFINQLMILGNEKAEFINALGKGYRSNGMRHPHSWSIVEPAECIKWIMNNIK